MAAYIVKYGEGSCRKASKTATVTLSRAELDNLRKVSAGSRDKAMKNINRLAILMSTAALSPLAGLGASITLNEFSGTLQKALSSSPEKIDKLLLSKSGYYKVTLRLNCVDKGRNGHYLSLDRLDPIK